MFLESCKQPEVRGCQSRAVGRAYNNFKYDALTTEVAVLVWSMAVSCWRSIGGFFFGPNERDWFDVTTTLGSSRNS
jgi:hypothetical protein